MKKEGREVLTGSFDSARSILRTQPTELKIANLIKRLFKNKRKEKFRNYD